MQWVKVMKHISLITIVLIYTVSTLTSFAAPQIEAAQGSGIQVLSIPYENDTQTTFVIKYDGRAAVIGGNPVSLNISVKEPKRNQHDHTGRIDIIKCQPREQSPITFPNDGRVSLIRNTDDAGFLLKTYSCSIQISPGAKPRLAPIAILFHDSAREGAHEAVFDFAVGVSQHGRIRVESNDGKPITLITGTNDGGTTLRIFNEFPDYTMVITGISIFSTPSSLIEPKEWYYNKPDKDSPFPADTAITIPPLDDQPIPLKFPVRDFTFNDWFYGISQSAQLHVRVQYRDGYGRNLFDEDLNHRIEIKAKPNFVLLLFCLFVGLLIGFGARIGYKWLRTTKTESTSGCFVGAFISFVVGLIVLLIVSQGEFELQAFASKLKVTPENPLMIWLVGVAIGLYDPLNILKRMGLDFTRRDDGSGSHEAVETNT